MEWSNERVLEFLEHFEMEQCLWNPRVKNYKSRSAQSDAWRRILDSLSFKTTVEELKKKKDSLMGYYRIHLNKYKKSLELGTETNDVYTTNWFAFESMNNFLRPIYGTNTIKNSESIFEDKGTEDLNEETKSPKVGLEKKANNEAVTKISNSSNNDSAAISTLKCEETKTVVDTIQDQNKDIPKLANVEKDTQTAFGSIKETNEKKQEFDEYDYFAHMLASKIRKIENMDSREILMNSIQNLTFQFYLKDRKLSGQTTLWEQSSSKCSCCLHCQTTMLSADPPK